MTSIDASEWAAATVRNWVGVPAGVDWTPPPMPDDLVRLLLRLEEHERPHRDRWGCWEFGQSENFRRGALWVPEVDRWVAKLRADATRTLDLVPLWPDGRTFAVCLTHDVDFVSARMTPGQLARSLRAATADRDDRLAIRAARPAVRLARVAASGVSRVPSAAEALQRCVEVERDYGVTSSYFFTVFPERGFDRVDCLYLPGDRCRFDGQTTTVGGVMRTLAAEGFDVGLHGSYNSAVVPGMLRREKDVLERALGAEIRTTRQHFLHWDAGVTPRLQDEAGLVADSTLGFNRNVGFRAGTCLPYHPLDASSARPLGLLEVPLVLHDGPLLRPDGLELDVATAIDVARQLVGEVETVGGVATTLFHPNSLARDDFAAIYRALLDHARDRGAWITSLRGVAEWWIDREALLNAS